MCEITSTIKSRQLTGYKIARQVGKHYYSFATGIEYKPGMVKVPKRYGKYRYDNWGDILHFISFRKDGDFISEYKGFTAIFKNFNDAKNALQNLLERYTNLIILEMTLDLVTKKGIWINYDQEYPIYMGKKIISIKKVK